MALSTAKTSAGTRIYLSAAPANILNGTSYQVSDFSALTYTEVGECSDLGTFGKKVNSVKFNPLADRRTVKRKGSIDNGAVQLKGAVAPNNAGQVLLQTALADDNSYCFKVVVQSGTIYYFTGQVMSYQLAVGGVDSIFMFETDVEIDGDILTA